jgi:hypothetical protein
MRAVMTGLKKEQLVLFEVLPHYLSKVKLHDC